MFDAEKSGSLWSDDELDAIVADYFEMLEADTLGKPYVKLHHSEALMTRIGRSHRSVEFKHQNISAVLEELGMPWIPGYKPKRNYQNAILDAIDRYLTQTPDFMASVTTPQSVIAEALDVFVDTPPKIVSNTPAPKSLRRLIRKFDPAARDEKNRMLGKAGEQFVVQLEQKRLVTVGRVDLAKRVRWVADEDGDGAGYDVLSFCANGHERLVEVKTTHGSARTPFYVTRNEYEMAAERPNDWCIYRVHLFSREPRVLKITPPLEHTVVLTPYIWRASFVEP